MRRFFLPTPASLRPSLIHSSEGADAKETPFLREIVKVEEAEINDAGITTNAGRGVRATATRRAGAMTGEWWQANFVTTD